MCKALCWLYCEALYNPALGVGTRYENTNMKSRLRDSPAPVLGQFLPGRVLQTGFSILRYEHSLPYPKHG